MLTLMIYIAQTSVTDVRPLRAVFLGPNLRAYVFLSLFLSTGWLRTCGVQVRCQAGHCSFHLVCLVIKLVTPDLADRGTSLLATCHSHRLQLCGVS